MGTRKSDIQWLVENWFVRHEGECLGDIFIREATSLRRRPAEVYALVMEWREIDQRAKEKREVRRGN